MFQTVLMLLASPQNAARTGIQADRPVTRMATRARSALAPGYAGICAQGCDEGSIEAREDGRITLLAVVGNALGFALLMTGLWLLVRLAESLLG